MFSSNIFFVLNMQNFQHDPYFRIPKSIPHPNQKTSQMPILSSSIRWFLVFKITRTESAQRTKVSQTRNVDVTHLVGEADDDRFKEELEDCRYFPVDSQMDNGRHRVCNFAMEILDTHTSSQNLDSMFEKLNCAVKLNVAFGFVLKHVENLTCRYYYSHGKKHSTERSKLVATMKDFFKIRTVFE